MIRIIYISTFMMVMLSSTMVFAEWTELDVNTKKGYYHFSANRKLSYKNQPMKGFSAGADAQRIAISPVSPDSIYVNCVVYDEKDSSSYLLNLKKYTATKLKLGGPPAVWASWSPKSTHLIVASYYEADMSLYSVDLKTMSTIKIPISLATQLQEQKFDLDSISWTSPQTFSLLITINCNPYTDENNCTDENRNKIMSTHKIEFNVINSKIKYGD